MDEKRTLDELKAIYRLEPSLRDIFVEGRRDKCFLDWYLRGAGCRGVSVYSVDLFEVSNDILQKHSLTAGSNRSLVLALASEFAEFRPEGLNILCLADRDFEDYLPTIAGNSYLAFTDCNSLDLYAFTTNTLEKFVAVALGGLPISTRGLMDVLTSILERIYAMRLANELLAWSMEWIPFTRYVDMKKEKVLFKDKEFMRAYLQKNNRWQARGIFEAKVEELRGRLLKDPTRRIRGHDLGDLLLHVLRHVCREKKFGNAQTIEGCLMAAVERVDLDGLPLFRRILALGDAT